MLNCQTSFLPLWDGSTLRRSQCNVISAVRRKKSISFFLNSTFIHNNSVFFFLRWLGQNSKQNKLSRQLGDVQIRMRLKVSGDKSEIRQSYIPALFPHIVKPLIDMGVVRFLFFFSFFFELILDANSHPPPPPPPSERRQ